MHVRARTRLLTSLCLAALMSWPAHGADTPTAKKTLKTPPPAGAISRATGHHFREGLTASFTAEGAQKHTLQTNDHGLLAAERDGALPLDLWDNQDAGTIRPLLEKLAPNSAWPNTLTLARRLLLTEAPWPTDAGLQALRLQKMIEFGAYTEAARLYQHLDPAPGQAELLAQGVRAMMLTGEATIACVELKANADGGALSPRLTKLNDLCDSVLTHDETATIPAPATPASDATSAAPTLATLATATAPILHPENLAGLRAIDPDIIELLPILPGVSLDQLRLTNEDQLTPLEISVLLRRADIPGAERLALYPRSAEVALPDIGPAALPTTKSTPFLQFLAEMKEGIALDHANAFAHGVAGLKTDTPLRLRTLLASGLESATPDPSFTLPEVIRITSLLLAIDSPRASVWLTALRTRLGETPTHSPVTTAVLILGQTRGHESAKGPFPLSFSQLKTDKKLPLGKLLHNLSELLDSPPTFIDNPPNVYEKKSGLTKHYNYVMSSRALRDYLSEAIEKRQTGRAILASLLFLQGQEPREIDPDVLATVLKSLIAIDRGEEARQTATIALLGIIEGEEDYGASRPSSTTEAEPASGD